MAEHGEIIRIDRQEVKITRPEKVLFPGDGIRKRDLVDYYRRISSRILPHLRARPLMLERYPDGIDKTRIVQKAATSYYPDWIKTVTIGGAPCRLKAIERRGSSMRRRNLQGGCAVHARSASLSCRSIMRATCITTSGWRSMECSSPGQFPKGRAWIHRPKGSRR